MLSTETFLVKIMLLRKKLYIQNHAFKKTSLEYVLIEIARQTQNLRILRCKLNQNVEFLCAKIFSKSAS